MGIRCPECGAPVSEGATCQENLHRLLFREAEVPGVPGSIWHFLVVTCYNLQHPDSMRLTEASLRGALVSLRDVLDKKVDIEDLRRRARYAARGAARVTRRAGEIPPAWHRGPWPMHAGDVYTAPVAAFTERVWAWAQSISNTLGAAQGKGT